MPPTPDGHRADRIVFLHGFTQTHHHWHPVAIALGERLGADTAIAFVDLPGHGLSTRDTTAMVETAGAAASLGGRGTYVGYSLGGRIALLAALARPDLVDRLVLIGATAGIASNDERATRRAVDHERAERVEQLGVDRFLDEWLSAPMFAGLPTDPELLEHRRRNTVAGLAHSLRSCGTGSQPSIWDRLGEIAAPALVIAGARDSKFVAIGQRLADALPSGSFVAVPDAGHAAHAEAPDVTVDLLEQWLVAR